MDTPRNQVSEVTYVTAASDNYRITFQYMEFHIQYFNQKRFLNVKDIYLI